MGGLSRVAMLGGLCAVLAYFAIGCTLSLEYIDEGQILYPSWLVSLGAAPYRDFSHMYGPVLFAVNGALFRWVAPDLLVIRISLAVLKTITVMVTYLLARRAAPKPFALLACGLLAIVWGTPVYVFNIPYANHYSVTFVLAGLLGFLSLPRQFRIGCFLAGVCFGVAAAFKNTAGLFGFFGFALFLLWTPDAAERPAGPGLPAWCVRSGRAAALAAMFGLSVLYVWPRNTLWNVVVLFTPAALLFGVVVFRELREPLGPGMRAGFWGIVYTAIGAAVVPLAFGTYYAARGRIADVFFDLVYGLPQKVNWFHPYPTPDWPTALFFVLLAAGFAAVGLARSRDSFPAQTRLRTASMVAVVAIGLLLPLTNAALGAMLLAYLRSRRWYGAVIALWFAVPLIAVWLTGIALFRSSRQGTPAWDGSRRTIQLFFCNGIASMFLLYPGAELSHVAMGLPAFAPLCAFLMERFQAGVAHSGNAPRTGRWAAAALIAGLTMYMAAPSIDQLVTTAVSSRSDTVALDRATRIHGTQPKVRDVAALLDYLRKEVPPQQEMLALSCEQLLYFLAGRRSAFERHEFVFYLIGTGMITGDDARGLVDQEALIQTLAERRPVIIDGGDPWTDGRLRSAFDQVSRYIDVHYRVATSVANYRVLTWAD